MESYFDNSVKEEIRSIVSIADVVGRYVALKPAGQYLKGLCPFHKEKTPSFTVSPDKGIFYCFGCHKGGDVFRFIMEIENVSFIEALKILADEAGIKLKPVKKYLSDNKIEEKSITKEDLFNINNLALSFFYNQTKNYEHAKKYLLLRGLTKETIRDFKIGYAPPSGNAFYEYAKQNKISENLLIQAGLIISKSNSGFYDRFRDRIIFPIFDSSSRPIGFAGRSLSDESQAKYINSPETLLYQKNKILYGLNVTSKFIKEKKSVIITEGYMDFLSLFQAGIKNIVATCGTAFSDSHANILKRLVNKIYLVFDGDEPGIQAAKRAIYILAPYSFDTRVLVIPKGLDPDEYVKTNGAEKFLQILNANSKDFMTFMLEKAKEENNFGTAFGKSAIINALLPIIQIISDPVVKSEFIKKISEDLLIQESIIYQKIKKSKINITNNNTLQNAPGISENFFNSVEGYFIRLLLSFPILIDLAKQFIAPETFSNKFISELYSIILNSYCEDPSLKTIFNKLEDQKMQNIISFAFAETLNISDPKSELIHIIKRIQDNFILNKIKEISQKIKNEPQNREELLKKLKEYSLQRKELNQ